MGGGVISASRKQLGLSRIEAASGLHHELMALSQVRITTPRVCYYNYTEKKQKVDSESILVLNAATSQPWV